MAVRGIELSRPAFLHSEDGEHAVSVDAHLLIAVDVGNSRTKCALFDCSEESAANRLPRPLNSAAVPLDDEIPWSEIHGWIDPAEDQRVTGVIAGANPAGVENVLRSWPSADWPRPSIVSDPSSLPVEVGLAAPQKVGIDRLLVAVAANVIRASESAVIIIDAGTATTVDFVSADGLFQGGAILPGLELAARALHRYTALLPLISVEELTGEAPDSLGRNTRDALRSGLFYGQLAAVKEFIAQFTRLSRGPGENPSIFLTGGGACVLAPHLPEAHHEPHLALQGLALVAEQGKRKK